MTAAAIAIVVLVGAFAAAIGVIGQFTFAPVSAFARLWQSPTGLWAAVAMRVVFGAALWIAAPVSRTPLVFQVLAAIALAAAAALAAMGPARFKSLLEWWLRQHTAFQRSWLAASIAFGAFLLWSALL